MSLAESFNAYILKEFLFTKKDRLLIAVSGGVDSVVLCRLCKAAGYDFSIAHCNFQLRGEESNGDEMFLKELSETLDVPFYSKRFDTEKYAADNKISIQVAARNLRYDWFNELLSANATKGFILTAHHADDNIETILMNFFKGSGINGLKGILPKQQRLLRPLLFATKKEIVQYAVENNLTYREDSSNSSDKYTRNYFRNQLLPDIEKVFPQVKENLLQNAVRFREINNIYETAIDKIKRSLITVVGSEQHLPVLKLLRTPELNTVLYEIIKHVGFSAAQTGDVIKLLNSSSGKYVESPTHRILRNRKWLIIAEIAAQDHSVYLLEQPAAELSFSAGKIMLRPFSSLDKMDVSPFTAQLDMSQLQFPLLLRRWKTGDYFYPLGMLKKKKLSRFFVDQKLSLIEKEKIWVLESDKKIIWVIGHRIDDRFKITDKSAGVLQCSFLPA